MNRTALCVGLALALASSSALAQDALPQQESEWFKAGQAAIQEKLARTPITGRAKNIILFTADGNGVGTNYAIRLFSGQKAGGYGDDFVQPHENFPYLALVKTYATNAQTPDSAPTASAMNTGVKTKNDLINVGEKAVVGDCSTLAGNELKPFSEMASEAGKSVGVISTARLTHATPAAVYARTVDRDFEDNSELPEGCQQKDIADQLVDAIKAGTIDFAMGGGRRHFLPTDVTDGENKAGKRTDGRNLIEELSATGVQYAWNDETFGQLTTGNNKPILGLFESSHMKYEHDRTDEPSLAQMTETAIKALSSNENGFYLNIEAGRVDHANHDGNLYRTITDGAAFAEAIAKAVELTNEQDTLIIVTADHEHAIAFNGYCGRGSPINGLCYKINEAGEKHLDEVETAMDGKPYTVVGYLNGVGSVLKEKDGAFAGTRPGELTQAQVTDPEYVQQALIPMTSETHSGEDVAVYAKGPWAHLFDGTVEQNYIFHVMHYATFGE